MLGKQEVRRRRPRTLLRMSTGMMRVLPAHAAKCRLLRCGSCGATVVVWRAVQGSRCGRQAEQVWEGGRKQEEVGLVGWATRDGGMHAAAAWV